MSAREFATTFFVVYLVTILGYTIGFIVNDNDAPSQSRNVSVDIRSDVQMLAAQLIYMNESFRRLETAYTSQIANLTNQLHRVEGLTQTDQSVPKVDGGWSIWGSWTECSASCGTGMASRNRSCSNPKPSNGGYHCFGDSTEYKLCNRSSCSDAHAGFTVYNGDSSSGAGSNPLKFRSTLYNSDASFNTSTGVFTCIYPGLYFFSATVMRTYISATGEYSCYFVVNNSVSIRVFANANNNSASYPGSSASIVLRLNKNDRVNLGNCNDGTYMYSPGVSFAGFRISP